MVVQINNREIEITYSFRSLIIFEQIADKSFNLTNTTDLVTYFYSCILAKDNSVQWDDFLNWLDDNISLFTEFCEWIKTQDNVSANTKEKAKKKTRK